jgi:MFS family permease
LRCRKSTLNPTGKPPDGKRQTAVRVLAVLSLAQLAGMTPWFSATAVTASVAADFDMTTGQAAWLTMAVQVGFVGGTLVSAALNLADILSARWVFALGCALAASANLAVTTSGSPETVILFRFMTGAGLALVYPPAMKIAASWFERGRGAALGVLIGALTGGKAVPYLVAAIWVDHSWQDLVRVASWLSIGGGLLVLAAVRDGPYLAASAPFDPRAAIRVFRDRRTRLATFGYLGHMWELYAMWTWAAVFATASLAAEGRPDAERLGAVAGFLAIGSGALGCVVAGFAADRHGRARVASWAMMASGTCAALTAVLFGAPPAILFALVVVWGFTVVADSAQFSALVSQYASRTHVGTALTVQVSLGFLLTLVTIRLVPAVATALGWQWAFLLLVPGPVLGIAAMRALQRSEEQTGSSARPSA